MHLHVTFVTFFHRFKETSYYAPCTQFFLELLDRSKLLKCFWFPVHKRAYRNWCANIFGGQFSDVVDESGGCSDNVLPTVSVYIHKYSCKLLDFISYRFPSTIDTFTRELSRSKISQFRKKAPWLLSFSAGSTGGY